MAFVITKPIAEHRAESIANISTQAGIKITTRYPVYKQLNLSHTVDAPIMWDWIYSVRNESNKAELLIGSATNKNDIITIENNYIETLSLII